MKLALVTVVIETAHGAKVAGKFKATAVASLSNLEGRGRKRGEGGGGEREEGRRVGNQNEATIQAHNWTTIP